MTPAQWISIATGRPALTNCWLNAAIDSGCMRSMPFVLASDPDEEQVDAAVVFSDGGTSATFGPGQDVELLGGSVSLVSPGAVELVDLLPPAMIIRARVGAASSFAWLLDELDREWQSGQPGGAPCAMTCSG